METPNTVEGQLTEKIMARVMEKVWLPRHVYNPVWSAVLETLEKELAPLLRGKLMTREEFLKGPGKMAR